MTIDDGVVQGSHGRSWSLTAKRVSTVIGVVCLLAVTVEPWMRSGLVLLAYMLLRFFTKLYMPAPFDLFVFDIPYATGGPGAVTKEEMVLLLLTSHVSRDPRFALLSMGVAVVLLIVGGICLRLGRTRKYAVLYLRRFGYSSGTRVISASTRKALRKQFRVLTLDDGEFRPVAGPAVQSVWVALWAPVAVLAVGLIASGAFFLRNLFFRPEDWNPAMVMADRGLYGPALFRGFSEGVAVTWVWSTIYVWWLGHLIWRAAQKRRLVSTDADIGRLGRWLEHLRDRQRRSHLSAPQTAIATTAHQLWKSTVEHVIGKVDAVLVDVSIPSESLLWELRKLRELDCRSCVLVGDRRQVEAWLNASATSDPFAAAMRDELGDSTVLAYQPDQPNDNFDAALMRMLLDAAQASARERSRAVGFPERASRWIRERLPRSILRSVVAWGVLPFVMGVFVMMPIVVLKRPLRAVLEAVFSYFV
jgi:hypothetical protein